MFLPAFLEAIHPMHPATHINPMAIRHQQIETAVLVEMLQRHTR